MAFHSLVAPVTKPYSELDSQTGRKHLHVQSLRSIKTRIPIIKPFNQLKGAPRTLEKCSVSHAKQKKENRLMIKIILSSIYYLSIQGLPLCGQYNV